MNKKIRIALLALLTVAAIAFTTGCALERSPYEINNSEDYTVSVKYDANGGVFTTNTYVIVDSFNIANMDKNSDGDCEIHLISPMVIEPVQDLKVNHLGGHNPRLHTDELLVALSISAVTNPTAEIAMQQLEKLKGSEAHSTVILSQVDENIMKKLGVNMTCEPVYQTKKLYHKR